MADQLRSPVYVPNPPQDLDVWNAYPRANGPLQLATTQVKFYGAPGQVPTKRWHPYQTYDVEEPNLWLGKPILSNPLRVATTQVKFFGAPGQVPTKRWQPYYNYNVAESQWNWPPRGRNYVLKPSPTSSASHYQFQLFNYADTTLWQGAPQGSDLLAGLAATALPLVQREPR
jgi:hypothetical protein